MMQSPKLILMQLQRIDNILKFYSKCPDGKRGRPMSVGKAAALEKASPGSICAKEVKANPSRGKGERTIFYRNKSKGEANTPTENKKRPTQSEDKRVEQEPIESGNVADHESKKTTAAPRTDTKFPVNKKEQDLQAAFRPIAEENNESLNPKQKELLHGFADRMAMMRSKSKQQDDVATETEKFKRARDLFLEVIKERPDLLDRMKKVQGVSASDVPLFLTLEVYKAIYNPDSLEGDPSASAYKQDLLGIARGEAVPNIQKILPDQKLEIATAQSESQKKWAKIFHRQMSSGFRKYASSFLTEHPQAADYLKEAWANLHRMPTAGSIFGLRSVKGNQLLLSLLSPQSTESLAGQMGMNLAGSENGKRFISIMRGKFKDNPEFQKALTTGQPWPQQKDFTGKEELLDPLFEDPDEAARGVSLHHGMGGVKVTRADYDLYKKIDSTKIPSERRALLNSASTDQLSSFLQLQTQKEQAINTPTGYKPPTPKHTEIYNVLSNRIGKEKVDALVGDAWSSFEPSAMGPHRRYSNVSDVRSTLKMLDYVDSMLQFLAECPGNKRGRPMKSENAQRLAQASPDSICTKKTASGNTRYYRTAPKAKSSKSQKKKSLWERVFGKKKTSRRKTVEKTKADKSQKTPQETPSSVANNEGGGIEKIRNDLAVLKDILKTAQKGETTKSSSAKKSKIQRLKEGFGRAKIKIGEWKKKHPVLATVALPLVKISLGSLGIPFPFQQNDRKYISYHLNRLNGYIHLLEAAQYGHRTRIYRMEKNAKFFATAGGRSNQC